MRTSIRLGSKACWEKHSSLLRKLIDDIKSLITLDPEVLVLRKKTKIYAIYAKANSHVLFERPIVHRASAFLSKNSFILKLANLVQNWTYM